MITFILLFIVLGLILHYYALHHGKEGRLINLISGPPPLPLIGNAHVLAFSKYSLWENFRRLAKHYYPIYRLWNTTYAIVHICHPNDIEAILGNAKLLRKSYTYKLLRPWFGTGLLTSAGSKWQVRRKVLTPAFHFNVLQQFGDIMMEEGERMTEYLKSEGKPVVKNLVPLISHFTLNMICDTAMGTSLKGKEESQEKYRDAVHEMGKVLIYRLLRPWLHTDLVFSLLPQGRQQTKLLSTLHGFTRKIIMKRKEYHDETKGRYLTGFDRNVANDPTEDEQTLGFRKKRLAMLDLLIAAHRNNQIDDEGIREEVDTFMFEGHDTTATSLCFTIMLLAEHKEIQDRARAEVNAVLEEHGGKMSPAILRHFQFLDRCIKESLRLYPSVHSISREIEHDVRLSNYVIPANTVVRLQIVDVHRDPNFWENPDVFDPDRFLPERSKGRHPYSYIPFSAGPRNCIGQRFAMMELKTTLAFLLHNFYLEPVDYLKDITLVADLVIRPKSEIRTKFIPIETSKA